MQNGLVHLYWGEGKGKTTAAMGLALRALGHGRRVVVLQFLKGTPSGEVPMLERLGATVLRDWPGEKFAFQMEETELEQARCRQTALLRRAMAQQADLLVLDEACAAWQLDLVDRALLQRAVEQRAPGCEVVLTGRDPAPWMQACADYSTELCCRRHPYERGVPARQGIEF